MQRPEPRPGIQSISPYVPGKAKVAGTPVHKLSSNESALGPAPSAIDALQDVAALQHRYPDGHAQVLRDKLSAVYDLPADQLIIGAGSDELLSLMIRCYSSPGDEVLMTRHGFSYYPIAAMAEGCVPVQAQEDDLVADVDALLAAVTAKTRLLFLANPNNPTGTLLPRDEIQRLRDELPSHIMLVLDGAYAEYRAEDDYDPGHGFVRDAALSGFDNVIMTRTFSKIYGLGGLRVGWAFAPTSVIEILNRVRGPFNVSAPGIVSAAAALNDQDFVQKNRAHNDEEMARLAQALRGGGLHVRETKANFILIDCGSDEKAAAFLQHCEDHYVLVRGLASSNLPTMVRVSIGDRTANDAFLDAALSFSASADDVLR
ncbi:MAG: histidinol-phosphate transaminase [Pseudomonadota bacterium]